jgi:hypothetical protein
MAIDWARIIEANTERLNAKTRRVLNEVEQLAERGYFRDHGEQPEPAPVSVVGCPYCQRVPCEDQVHALWRLGLNGVET